MERLTVDAGFPNENKGINEKPLLVRFIFPENWSFFLGWMFSWLYKETPERKIKQNIIVAFLKVYKETNFINSLRLKARKISFL